MNKIQNEIDHEKYDFYVLVNTNAKQNHNSIYAFNKDTIEKHGFDMHMYYYMPSNTKQFYGHNFEYSFMSFYEDHPNYQFYWLIEWDVYCNGNWNDVLTYYDKFTDVDFYTTHIDIGCHDNWQKKWLPFSTYHWIKTIQLSENNMCKCFNPIDRFSNKALAVLIESYKSGDYGFYEIAMPTIFLNKGLIIKSFGATTEISDKKYSHEYMENENEFINDKTNQYCHQYIHLNEMEAGKVYHPVKNFPNK